MGSSALKESLIAGGILGALMLAGALRPAVAQQEAAPPDFSSHGAGWVGLNGGGPFFEPIPGRLAPVTSDPAHPFIPNGVGQTATFRIADLSNPNLMPWVKEHMKRDIDEVLAGTKSAFTAHSSCQPAGVPLFMAYGGANPIIFLQTPKELWMIFTGDQQVRRVYLDAPIRLIPSRHGTASRSAITKATRSSSIPSG